MLKANKQQARHKSIMFRVLINILDNSFLAENLVFKGGTCASMLGYLDRFSVDLDFDVKNKSDQKEIKKLLEQIFSRINLTIKDQSQDTIQYFLKYEAPPNTRNTLKLDAVDIPNKFDQYEKALLPEINRYCVCQTKETLFANKLVTLVDRYEQKGTIAGRDLYDIHHYLQQGLDFNNRLIEERRQTSAKKYLEYLIEFITDQVNQTIINQDLNFLLDFTKFNSIRRTLKTETIALLKLKIKELN